MWFVILTIRATALYDENLGCVHVAALHESAPDLASRPYQFAPVYSRVTRPICEAVTYCGLQNVVGAEATIDICCYFFSCYFSPCEA